MSELTDFDIDVLRILSGDNVPGMVRGAAMWEAASLLKARGYAEGHYRITDKGRAFLFLHRAQVRAARWLNNPAFLADLQAAHERAIAADRPKTSEATDGCD